jgi:hypothetical protein
MENKQSCITTPEVAQEMRDNDKQLIEQNFGAEAYDDLDALKQIEAELLQQKKAILEQIPQARRSAVIAEEPSQRQNLENEYEQLSHLEDAVTARVMELKRAATAGYAASRLVDE